MGLSIHYAGYLRDIKLLDQLIKEVKDICETLGWAPQTIDDGEIKGVCFAPKGSEPVFLTFDQNRHLLSPINIMTKEIYDGIQLDKDLIFTTSTKTQYAGPDAHIALIRLLKHIAAKYLNDFALTDEGYYWESGDENILLNQFKKYNTAVANFCKALEGLSAVPGETYGSLADRLEALIRKKIDAKTE